MKRVFISINLPDFIKEELENTLAKIRPLFGREVRFLSPDNWHLTIEFLGYQDDNAVSLISDALEAAGGQFQAPTIKFEKIIYGPIDKTPRMIWLTGSEETSRRLSEIKNFLESKLGELGVNFRSEQRSFKTHLTLARFEATARKNLPQLEIPFAKEFMADSLDFMESHLKRSGAEYELLAKFDFKISED